MKYDRILASPGDSSPGLVGRLIFGGLNRASKRGKGARIIEQLVGFSMPPKVKPAWYSYFINLYVVATEYPPRILRTLIPSLTRIGRSESTTLPTPTLAY